MNNTTKLILPDNAKAKKYSGLHLSNLAVVPGVNITCDLTNSAESQFFQHIFEQGEKIVVVSSNESILHPKKEDIFSFGCLARIEKVYKQAPNILKIALLGEERVRIERVDNMEPVIVYASIMQDRNADTEMAHQKMEAIKRKCRDAGKFDRYFPPDVESQILYGNMTPSAFADSLVHMLVKELPGQQEFVAEDDVEKRLDLLTVALDKFIGNMVWRKQIDDRVNANLSKNQKEAYLREQLHVINDELYGELDEIEVMRAKVRKLGLVSEDEEKVLKEINRLSKLPFGSPEMGYIRNFIETVLELPWTQRTEDTLELKAVKKVLDEEHYALDKVKQRILECVAVMRLTGKVSSQILCLVGPPGVGKTSIAESIAKAMGRKFVQISLGGVGDESVIRGHRRTYVGAMCGRILAGMKQAGTINPVFLLDEVDKMTQDAKGDPASALLEVLDPAQNNHFKDNFLELPYDLSQVLFIVTANTLQTIPAPLLDRMEIIELRSYTEIEKIFIAKRHLIKKQEKLAGLELGTVPFTDELLSKIIRDYTYEAGVRGLERSIASVCRKYAAFKVSGGAHNEISLDNLPEFLGDDFTHEPSMYQGGNIGEVVGLSVTSVGIGRALLVETTITQGDKKITLTGRQGEVMKESAQAAYSLVQSLADKLGIDSARFKNSGLHIHIPHLPNGVEGPSAGIATTTAIASVFTNRAVRAGLAMTGEVSLRGRVLAVGGIRDKLIAASRAGIDTVIIPKDNERDLKELPKEIRNTLKVHLVTDINEVFSLALV